MTRRLFGTLCGLVLLVNFGRTVFAPLVEPLQVAFGVGPATIGFVTTLVWVGSALPRIPVGYVLTRVPRHHVVLTAGGLLSVSAAFTASATSIWTLQLGALAIGIASGGYFVAAIPLIGELRPDRVGRSIGIHGTAAQIAAVIAAPIAVAAVTALDWRAAFWALAVTTAVTTILLAGTARAIEGQIGTGPDRDFSAVLTHWRVVVVGLIMIVVAGFVWQGVFNFYVSYLIDAKSIPAAQAGGYLTIVFAAGVPAFWLSGQLVDRFAPVPYILTMLGVYATSLFMLTRVSGIVGILSCSILIGFAIHSLFPALDTWLLGVLPSEVRASAYAVFSGIALLIEATGSSAVGLLTAAGYTFDAVFTLFAAGVAVVLIALLIAFHGGSIPQPAAVEPTGE
ncbi:MFS transporter [Haloquadratum walsbyi]|uniref:Major facilitator superfamily transport protein n=2 Tax=Haloquadratum walsbyi TaxID=293091 RepID=Q18HS2_HALWD|nr:MFS transporter [Haloquadratum walsbyi]CAJ52463.1 major facilitator superfamily transport protein [Haloquadratum walsbyi DSM 16790]CCC40426.1 major facilitator superfamily transport protein [Haloquadratum walsbyi C23]